MTADKTQSAKKGIQVTRIRSTHRTTARRNVIANKRKHKLTKHMITPSVRCHSLPAAKHHRVAPSTSLGRDRVVSIATRWTVRGSNTVGDEIFLTRPDQNWGPPRLLYNGYRDFFGGKADGA